MDFGGRYERFCERGNMEGTFVKRNEPYVNSVKQW